MIVMIDGIPQFRMNLRFLALEENAHNDRSCLIMLIMLKCPTLPCIQCEQGCVKAGEDSGIELKFGPSNQNKCENSLNPHISHAFDKHGMFTCIKYYSKIRQMSILTEMLVKMHSNTSSQQFSAAVGSAPYFVSLSSFNKTSLNCFVLSFKT